MKFAHLGGDSPLFSKAATPRAAIPPLDYILSACATLYERSLLTRNWIDETILLNLKLDWWKKSL